MKHDKLFVSIELSLRLVLFVDIVNDSDDMWCGLCRNCSVVWLFIV